MTYDDTTGRYLDTQYTAPESETPVALVMTEYYETDLYKLSPESGKLAQVTLGGSAVNYYYDYKGQPYETVYSQSGTDKLTFTYFSRDDEDRITGIIENDNGSVKETGYKYDSFGRLLRVKNDGEIKTTYYYDTNGNRTHRCTPETGCIELHYNAQDQLTQYGTTRYTYTLNGELKTKTTLEGITVYDHDPMGNLSQVILPNNTVIGYTYDAKNRRVAKMVKKAKEKSKRGQVGRYMDKKLAIE
jgi:YD repeat-containing protein